MRRWIVSHARPAFWLWCLPPSAFLLWCATWMETRPLIRLFLLFTVWVFLGGILINFLAYRRLRAALEVLAAQCDPRPLLGLCRTVRAQNPNSVVYQVYEAYALTLLGREEEARQCAEQCAGQKKLWKNPLLLLLLSVSLPSEHPLRLRAQQALEKAVGRMRHGKRRQLLEDTLLHNQVLSSLETGGDELEAPLTAALERAGCTHEQVAAHLALGAYYARRRDLRAEAHLEFVLAHANHLAVRPQAEALLCLLPPARR